MSVGVTPGRAPRTRAAIGGEVHLFEHERGVKPSASLCGRATYTTAAATQAIDRPSTPHLPICFDCWREAGWKP